MKVLIDCSPAVLGECAGLERSAFIFTTSVPRPVTLGGCGDPDGISTTVREKVFCGLPPYPHPAPGLLGVELFLLPLPPPPHPLPLLNCLPLNLLCLCLCGLPGEGEHPEELCLIPELLHC